MVIETGDERHGQALLRLAIFCMLDNHSVVPVVPSASTIVISSGAKMDAHQNSTLIVIESPSMTSMVSIRMPLIGSSKT